MIRPLSTGVSALLAAQRALEVTSHNIANVNTPGYTRQRIELVATAPTLDHWVSKGNGLVGGGVRVATIRQLRDSLVDEGRRAQLGERGAHSAAAQSARQLEGIVGPLDAGLGRDLNDMWASFTDLSNNPTSLTARASVLDTARRLAGSIRSAFANVETAAANSRQALTVGIDRVNGLMRDVAELNQRIAETTTPEASPNDLLDARNNALDELAELTGAKFYPDGTAMNVYFGGTLMVSGNLVSDLQVAGSPPVVTSAGQPVTLQGAMGTHQSLATNGLDDLRQRLDLLATGLRDALNTAHQAGFDQSGAPGVAFFTGTGARDLQVNAALTPAMVAASASGAPGDGNNALALGALRNQPTIGTPSAPGTPSMTANDAFGDLVAELGRRSRVAETGLEIAATTLGSYEARRDEISGVSIDEEMTEMLRYQRAYQAAARVITAADEMLDTLVNRLGIVGR